MESPPSTLLQLLERSSSLAVLSHPAEDLGVAETVPFPFLAVVGQLDLKIAMLLGLTNPRIGGILLTGPRGTGKTTIVRSLTDLLPHTLRSICPHGCTEEAVEEWGMDAICPDCAVLYGQGIPLTAPDRVRLIELPLSARMEDVVGGIDERIAIEQKRVRLQRGILSQADQNILYVDEINLLSSAVADAILDAAAQGRYTVRRGPLKMTYRSRLMLIGSMNPEEGELRPQIMDRFGLRVVVLGIEDHSQRMEIYRRTRAYLENPHEMTAQWGEETRLAAAEVERARHLLPQVELDPAVTQVGLELIRQLGIQSHRAEFTLFEAVRAHAALDARSVADLGDLRVVAPMALRLRRSAFMRGFIEQKTKEDREIQAALNATIKHQETGPVRSEARER
jgi:magnesium chelatase subunit I